MDNTTVRYAMALISGIAVMAMVMMGLLTLWGFGDSSVVLILSNVVSVVVGAIAGWVVAPKTPYYAETKPSVSTRPTSTKRKTTPTE